MCVNNFFVWIAFCAKEFPMGTDSTNMECILIQWSSITIADNYIYGLIRQQLCNINYYGLFQWQSWQKKSDSTKSTQRFIVLIQFSWDKSKQRLFWIENFRSPHKIHKINKQTIINLNVWSYLLGSPFEWHERTHARTTEQIKINRLYTDSIWKMYTNLEIPLMYSQTAVI